jgi:radical SAM superfamily enzyme YgiQ (UPF0313 family)
LWGAILAGYLRNMGYSVLLYDAEVENWTYQKTAEKIIEIKPLLAAIVVSGTNPSASTMNMTGAGRIATLIRQLDKNVKILLSGLHPSALPERSLKDEDIDFVCQGEGFFTLPRLLDELRNNSTTYSIKGLWSNRGGFISFNPRPPLKKNLDEVPMPAWDLLPMKKYRAHNWHCFGDIENRQPYAVIYTSLGCPFHCSFCCINALFGKNSIRYRRPDHVIEEIDFLVNNYDIKNIKIIDEMFAMKEARIINLCDMIIDRGYDLNMWAYARVDTVSEKMLNKMKRAGINWVAYGFESGDKKVLQGVTKGYKNRDVEFSVKLTRDAGQYIIGNFMFGLPDDDTGSMQQTLDLAIELNCEFVNFNCTMAYPGSDLYDRAIKMGLKLPETWEGYSQYGYETFPLATKYLTSQQVLRFRDHAFKVYFNNPNYLDSITRKFGAETARHIQEMAEHDLVRKYLYD